MKNYKCIVPYLMALILGVFTVTSCQQVHEPEDPSKNKGHDDPTLIDLAFTPGVLNDAMADSLNHTYAYDFTPENGGEQHVYWKINKDQTTEVIGSPTFVKGKWYHLNIRFKNISGADITNQFIGSEEMRSIHQFFLRPFKSMEAGIDEHISNLNGECFDYRYGDFFPTKLEIKDIHLRNGERIITSRDKSVRGIGVPGIGFDGYIKFNKEMKFYLNLLLVHIVSGTKYRDDDVAPFHGFIKVNGIFEVNPRMGGVTDVNFLIPVNIK